MKNKSIVMMVVLLTAFALTAPSSYAIGAKEAGASLLLPVTGQSMNGELSTRKSKIMAGVEIAAITTVAVLGTVVGGGVVWAGLGPLLANHAWSATDAYRSANKNSGAVSGQQVQMASAQQTLELSRQRRFDRAQVSRSPLHERVAQAAKEAYYAA